MDWDFLKIWAVVGPIIGGGLTRVFNTTQNQNAAYADRLRKVYEGLFQNLRTCHQNTLIGKSFPEFPFFRDFVENGTIDYLKESERISLRKLFELRKALPILSDQSSIEQQLQGRILEIARSKKRFYELRSSRPSSGPRPQITLSLAELILGRFESLNEPADLTLSLGSQTERFEYPSYSQDLRTIVSEIRDELLKEEGVRSLKTRYEQCLELINQLLSIARIKREKPLNFWDYLNPNLHKVQQ